MTALAMDVRDLELTTVDTGSGIVTLSSDEIDQVAGGPLPVLAVLAIKAVVYTGVGVAGAAAGVALVKAVKEAVT